MNNELTELVFILDRSGSMCGMEGDTIGGFNSVLNRQKEQPGSANVTTILFDDTVRLLHDRIPIASVKPMTRDDYRVGGCTALLDAVGEGIEKLVNVQRHMGDNGAAHVQFVIITDGLENASRHFSRGAIREMITHEREKYNWDFVFLGANMDAITAAEDIGIRRERAVDAISDHEGTFLQYEAVNRAISAFRSAPAETGCLDDSWKQEIAENTRKRRGR